MRKQSEKLRYGRRITGESFYGFGGLHVNELIYFTDEDEKKQFPSQRIIWRVMEKLTLDTGEVKLKLRGTAILNGREAQWPLPGQPPEVDV